MIFTRAFGALAARRPLLDTTEVKVERDVSTLNEIERDRDPASAVDESAA